MTGPIVVESNLSQTPLLSMHLRKVRPRAIASQLKSLVELGQEVERISHAVRYVHLEAFQLR